MTMALRSSSAMVLLLGSVTAAPSQPTGIHLAFAAPGSISVMWSTRRPISSGARWAAGHHGNATELPLTNQSGGSSVCPACAQYSGASPLCQWHHTVLISGLTPGQAVIYQVGDPFAEIWSPRLSFVAPDMLADTTFTAAFFADMGWQSVSDTRPGSSNGSTPAGCTFITQCGLDNRNDSIPNQVMPWLLARSSSYDFALHAGDISYADNVPGEDYDLVWDRFMDMVEPLASRVPYMVTPGNHEASCSQCCEPFPKHAPGYCDRSVCAWSANFTAYNTRFSMPGPSSATPTAAAAQSMYWSVNYKSVHLVGIDDSQGTTADHGFGDQLAWLADDLAQVNRSATPWVVVTGHIPYWSSCPASNCPDFNATFDPLFRKHGVDIYMAGHVHNYERTLPQGGVLHLMNGAAGDTEACTPFPQPSPVWSAHRYAGFGWGELRASMTSLEWKFFRSKDGLLEDQWSKHTPTVYS